MTVMTKDKKMADKKDSRWDSQTEMTTAATQVSCSAATTALLTAYWTEILMVATKVYHSEMR